MEGVIDEVAFVDCPGWELQASGARHLVVDPLTDVTDAVRGHVTALTVPGQDAISRPREGTVWDRKEKNKI